MFRSRTTIALVLLLAAGSLTLVLAQSEGGDTNDALIQKLDALEKRIISLERTLQVRLSSIEKSIAAGGGSAGPSPQMEGEANAALGKINALVNEGSFEQAKLQMGDFMKKYSTTNAAKAANRMNAELSVIGKTAPTDWGIEKWLQGESDVDLASDKTTLLIFWEVWCPHCKREVPKLQQIYSDLKGDGLQLVGITKVTRSATEEGVLSFVEENNVSYPVAKENGATSMYFNVSGIPAAAVVKDGKIVWRGHPARLSETMLKSWL